MSFNSLPSSQIVFPTLHFTYELKALIQSSRLLLISLLLVVVSGCVTSPQKIDRVESLSVDGREAKLIIMPIDVELSVLTAAGLLEPQAEWTENAIAHIQTNVNILMEQNGVEVELFDTPLDDGKNTFVQLEKLHQEVGNNIMRHQIGALRLPSKKDLEPDWSLGKEAVLIKNQTGADYALFVFMRDSYASAGRAGMMVFMAVASMGNVVLAGGQQVGFASLVDLNTGDVVWFNRLISGSGDLRTEDVAKKSIDSLLRGFPPAS